MTEIATGELAELFDVTAKTIADLARRGIIVSAGKRGRWLLQPSVSGYVRHLREEAAGRGGEAGAEAGEARICTGRPCGGKGQGDARRYAANRRGRGVVDLEVAGIS